MTELFGELDVPANVQEIIDDIARKTNEEGEEAALELLNNEFGSVCDGIDDDEGSDTELQFY
ncbi:MAG: hypothetical protein J07HX64_02204 [halophilic archaeon J07HX64]|jgi:hypothetical protein|nr:MAG: hypothetical protein J07HX64_02204 [halophilic archaeon J07HX64]